MTSTIPQPRTNPDPLLVPHPGVDPHDTAAAVLEVMQLGAVGEVGVPAAELGPCLACPPLSPVPAAPAVVVLCHRETEEEMSWLHRWPLCHVHLRREVLPIVAARQPCWIEIPKVVLA